MISATVRPVNIKILHFPHIYTRCSLLSGENYLTSHKNNVSGRGGKRFCPPGDSVPQTVYKLLLIAPSFESSSSSHVNFPYMRDRIFIGQNCLGHWHHSLDSKIAQPCAYNRNNVDYTYIECVLMQCYVDITDA